MLSFWFYSIFGFMSILWIVVCPFVLFLLAIVLSVLLRYSDSDYPFDIFKLFLAFSIVSLLSLYFPHKVLFYWPRCVYKTLSLHRYCSLIYVIHCSHWWYFLHGCWIVLSLCMLLYCAWLSCLYCCCIISVIFQLPCCS